MSELPHPRNGNKKPVYLLGKTLVPGWGRVRFLDKARSITVVQAQTLACMIHLMKHKGFPPSQREIARELQCTQQSVQDRLKRLKKHGFVKDMGAGYRVSAPTQKGVEILEAAGYRV